MRILCSSWPRMWCPRNRSYPMRNLVCSTAKMAPPRIALPSRPAWMISRNTASLISSMDAPIYRTGPQMSAIAWMAQMVPFSHHTLRRHAYWRSMTRICADCCLWSSKRRCRPTTRCPAIVSPHPSGCSLMSTVVPRTCATAPRANLPAHPTDCSMCHSVNMVGAVEPTKCLPSLRLFFSSRPLQIRPSC